MYLFASEQNPFTFFTKSHSLIWREILNHLLIDDRLRLRRVCRASRDVVDACQPHSNRLFVIYNCSISEVLTNYYLFPYYTNQASENSLTNDASDKPQITKRYPTLNEFLNVENVDCPDSDQILPIFNLNQNRLKSVVLYLTISSNHHHINLNVNQFDAIESLEIYNRHDFSHFHDRYRTSFNLTDFENCSMFSLRRLLVFGFTIENVLAHCPNLETLKINIVFPFFSEIRMLRKCNKVFGLRKLHISLNYDGKGAGDYLHVRNSIQTSFLEYFVSSEVLQVLPRLEKLTLTMPIDCFKKVNASFPFYRIPRISIRLLINDQNWNQQRFELLRRLVSIIQVQLKHGSFEIKINGNPITSETDIDCLQNYLANFLNGSKVNPKSRLDTESADRFRSSPCFKQLRFNFYNSTLTFPSLKWPFLTSLYVNLSLLEPFLKRVPQDFPLLQTLGLSNLGSEVRCDFSFVFKLRKLINLQLEDIGFINQKSISKMMVHIKTLRYFNAKFLGIDKKFYNELTSLTNLNDKLSVDFKFQCFRKTYFFKKSVLSFGRQRINYFFKHN